MCPYCEKGPMLKIQRVSEGECPAFFCPHCKYQEGIVKEDERGEDEV